MNHASTIRCAHCGIVLADSIIHWRGEVYCCAGCVAQAQKVANQTKELEQLRLLVTIDPLTQMAARGQLENAWASISHPLRAAVLFVDIDHFKSLNDRWGHSSGDAVLTEVGRRIAMQLREGDACIRYGGEEFVILLPETSLSDAQRVAERIRSQISAQPFLIRGRSLWVTISVGVSANSEKMPRSLTTLLDEADQAMYSAKLGGRNRVALASVFVPDQERLGS
ncbi:GGDEF domain-containing protein [Sulfobacillus thermosulfidooxidans]|uniref:GGDEF domain-containing protein n=1 Tax=Sulfobacillus thermosulfidooxidans TaxID=28034 RepID=UPI0006B56539|nr:GGDEF domain-containing protein [Sulfobacillus thermosulfidooxidans]